MIFSFLRRRRRRKLLAEPFPPAWGSYLAENFHQFALLPEPLRARLRDRMRVFAAEKYWEGVGGLEVTEEMRAVVSAMACTLTLAFDDDEALYPNASRVIFYPETIVRRRSRRAGAVVIEGEEHLIGEAWSERNARDSGVVTLVWADVVKGGVNPNDGRNLVYHEFAHVLDAIGGVPDGVPPVGDDESERTWQGTFRAEFDSLAEAWETGRGIPLDAYALTSEAELFAVATESYLERPRLLRLKLPRLYDLLDSFYRLGPAEW